MSYISQKFVKILIKLPAELCNQRLWYVYKQDIQSKRELWGHPLRTFRLCLHVGVYAR